MMSDKITQILEGNGIKFNYKAFNEKILRKKEHEQAILADKIKSKLGVQGKTLNLDETTEVIQALYNNNIYPESLSFEYLSKHKTENEIYKLLLQYKENNQFLHLYRDKLKSQIGSDGRLHADWKIDGAKTGRITCSNPNLQGFPNGIKEFFIPEEGNVFVIGDYNQIELRILAELAGENKMIKKFKESRDIHSETTALILQKNENLIDNAERKLGKKVNFSMVYGVSTYGLAKILNKEGISVTQSQADYIRTLFYRSYPNIFKLHNILLTADVIRSVGGKIWNNIPKGDVKRMNLPIQASAAEGFKEALALLVESLKEYPEWKLTNIIYDEVLLEVPAYEAEKAKQILQKSMIQGMESILKIVPVIVDIKIQDNWKK